MPGPLHFPKPELALLLALGPALLACEPVARAEQAQRPGRPERAAVTSASVSVAPRPASSFERTGAGFLQRHPRLPDTGEWRCAERAGVVWCAGGLPSAGVQPGLPEPAFHCGPRWGPTAAAERVCIDRAPEYPNAEARKCRFEQERGIQRSCQQAAGDEPARPLEPRALPACWLDKDCRSRRCDRGSCGCDRDADCERGRCEAGHCVEGAP